MSAQRPLVGCPHQVQPGDRLELVVGDSWVVIDAICRWPSRGGVWYCVVVKPRPGLQNGQGGLVRPGEVMCILDHAFHLRSVFRHQRAGADLQQRPSGAEGRSG